MSGSDTGWCGLVVMGLQWYSGVDKASSPVPCSCPTVAHIPLESQDRHKHSTCATASLPQVFRKPCRVTEGTGSPTGSSAWRWHTGPSCGCPDRAPPSQLASEVSAIVCYWPRRKKKPFGELPKSKRRCMHWLASATIHQDSAEIGLGNVLGNFIFLWSFVIIDRHRFNHSSQEITPDASCSSLWIALNRLLKLRDYFLRWKSIFLIMSNLLENEGTYCSLFSCHLC